MLLIFSFCQIPLRGACLEECGDRSEADPRGDSINDPTKFKLNPRRIPVDDPTKHELKLNWERI